jgi:threonine/homoserine/homoserine lactone efflux protein
MNALHAFMFGISLAIAIGPIALLIINNGLNYGIGIAVRSGFGAAAADLLYSLIALLVGARVVAALSAYERTIHILSGALLISIGIWLAFKSTLWADPARDPAWRPESDPKAFRVTFLLTIANPLTLVIFLGFAGQLSLAGDSSAAISLSLCIFFGSLLVQLAVALLGASLGKWITDRRVIGVLNLTSAMAIIAFGVKGMLS